MLTYLFLSFFLCIQCVIQSTRSPDDQDNLAGSESEAPVGW